jgi:anti-anti-sigma factor
MVHLSFDVRSHGADCVVIAVAGEVDMATAPQLADCVLDHPDTDVVVDLSQVGFLDSSGLNVLVQAYKRLQERGHTLRTAAEQDHVLRVIKMSGLDGYFHADNPTPAE